MPKGRNSVNAKGLDFMEEASPDRPSHGRNRSSTETARSQRATLESQPLQVGFGSEEVMPQTGGYSNGSSWSNRVGRGETGRSGRSESPDEYAQEGRVDGMRNTGPYGPVRDGLEKPGEQDGLEDALVRMKKKAYIRDASVTGLFVLSWYIFATILSIYNKWMFTPAYYNFPYPLFVTMVHQIVQFGLAFVIRRIWPSLRPKERPNRADYTTKVIPTAMTTGLDIGLSNLSLKTVTLTLYTMCKSSTLIFVLMFAFLFRLEAYSVRLILVISCISVGVFLMVFNATTVSIPGIIMIFTASAMAGLRWALTQLAMHKKEMGMTNPFATIYWLAPVMAVTLAIVSLIFEGWIKVFSGPYFEGFKAIQTLALITLPGAVAFAMVASEYYIIQRAGIVPLSIAGIFKEVSTIALSSWVFGDELTRLNEVGVVITVCGIATYSYHKYHKSVHGEVDSHGSSASQSREGDGFVPLVGAEDGALGDADERRHHRENREMYVLGDEDDDEDELAHDGAGRASTSSGRRKAKESDDFDEALLRRTR